MHFNDFIEFFLLNSYDENTVDKNGKLNPDYNSFKKTGIIPSIFEDWWDFVYSNHKDAIDAARSNACAEVEKIIACHNKDLGCSVMAIA